MSEDRKWITTAEAISLLPENSENVHTFRSGGAILLGCDWVKENLIKLINEHPKDLEIGGPMCRGMGHGLVLWDDQGPLFIEADKLKVEIMDPIKQKFEAFKVWAKQQIETL